MVRGIRASQQDLVRVPEQGGRRATLLTATGRSETLESMAYSRSNPRRALALTGGTLATLTGCGPLVPYDGDDAGDDTTGSTTATQDPTPSSTTSTTTPPPPPTTTSTTGPPPLDGPPQLIDAYFLADDKLQLVFSEPIAPTTGVDPSKFRLSVGYAGGGYYGYGTNYADLGNWNGEEYCYEYCEPGGCYEWCYMGQGPQLTIGKLESGPQAHQIVLSLDHQVNAGLCRFIDDIQDWSERGGIFVHYSNNGFPGIVDTQSEPLDAIAEHWVLRPNDRWASQQGDFPFMDPYIPIPCPF